jgi:galactokinase
MPERSNGTVSKTVVRATVPRVRIPLSPLTIFRLIARQLLQQFHQQFAGPPVIVRSPARINLLGEHTDYNDGFVLPAAINYAAYVAISERNDDRIILHSVEFNEKLETDFRSLKPVKGWPDYLLGVVHQLVKQAYPITGFNLMLTSDVPIGAGLSSSAAVACAVVFALNRLFDLNIEKLDQAKIAQQAEHEFAGTRCGIMDQFASIFGKKDQVIRLDCRSLSYHYIPFAFPDVSIVLFDTGLKHALASSAYNTRRKECETGVELIKKKYPQVKSLRDATPAMVDACLRHDPAIYNRCKYVVGENNRLLLACDYLQQNNLVDFGKKMLETHDGLSKLYEVSCPELDFLVEQVRHSPAVPGARMMGGGFGGCTINLVMTDQVDQVIHSQSRAYKQTFGKSLSVYQVRLSDGTSVIHH